ncbi:T-lymphoma invasion and metastasis-inducing protein 1 isoform X2 [Rhinatrema bivittatum]|nr:T-lymphoma invasion and metastasis-inducing protein 1 isoform X2 [Rhinatrema bivittatum]XP_029459471.1 T-lymphoma invasion and metastasis-inducing protein 1 isoform X2 [Rhinatrema bivittatum]XP_029459472.1 T-lymphoma invasion and metastasis-inducing protein 1 isoform X2 [Rhinatrema bivittatum]
MGNAESQNLERAFYEKEHASLRRKHTSRSLRLSNKSGRRTRRASSGKALRRNSEVITRSSSTPSIPQSLEENGLEPYSQEANLEDFAGSVWMDMGLRPVSYHTDSSMTPSAASSTVLTTASVQSMQDSEEGRLYGDEAMYLSEGDGRLHPFVTSGSTFMEVANFKKKRSKSADIWREDSMEFSLSDFSQEHLTSTEDILDFAEEKESEGTNRTEADGSLKQLDTCQRASSLSDLYIQRSSNAAVNGVPTNKFIGYFRDLVSHSPDVAKHKVLPMSKKDTSFYSNYNTLPCRKSHCLSEGASNQQINHGSSMQGRRAKTSQDVVSTGERSEFADSGIEGTVADAELLSRCPSDAASSYSPIGGTFSTSDCGSSVGDSLHQGVYENFRRELEMSSASRENLEEANCTLSDEQSSGTLSSPGQSDILLTAAQGTVRKAGTLAIKNFLVHKKNKKVESATRRKWKQYWVSLKGCTLFFYESDGRSGIDNSSIPKHAVWVENSIVQAVPEHPKKDFVFCLSNSLGDAFLFQTFSQTELENWVTAIHSACASAVARQHHNEDTIKVLKSEIKKVEQKIDMDEKMKKMGEMQLSAVTDSKKKKTILEQIFVWEQNLEQFQMDLFRYRCYLASLQGGELPNPKRLLAFASRPTKVSMGRLGIFSVSSFHALVAARTGESGVRRRTQAMSRSTSKRRNRFSSLWGLDTTSKKKQERPTINQVFGEDEDSVKKSLEGMFDEPTAEKKSEKEVVLMSVHPPAPDCDIWVPDYLTPSWVCLPNNQPVLTIIHPQDLTRDILEMVCKAHQLNPSVHYLRLRFSIGNQTQYYIPKLDEDIYELLYKEIEICPKITQHIQIDKFDTLLCNYGFSLSSVEEEGIQRLYVNNIKETGLAFKKGLKAGDEVVEINRKTLRDLNSAALKNALAQPSLSLTVRTYPDVEEGQKLTQAPPRRTDAGLEISDSAVYRNQVCSEQDFGTEAAPEEIQLQLSDEADEMSKSTKQAAAFCHELHEMNPSDLGQITQEFRGPQLATMKQLTDAEKLRKIICELLETEHTYVKDLNCLMERYLKPLQKETFLTQDELDVLFGNLTEMVEFQVEFLKTLEDGVRLVPDLEKLEQVEEFKKVLFSLGGSFLYYADRFKLYSAFCASHTKVPKVLVKAKTDSAFKAFLDAQNPKQQHSSTLESYLIKPIQRILKYPLLLKELFSHTDADSEEHYHLDVAIKTMNKVASHINEMQKIHEEYGFVFDQLIAEQTGEIKEVADLSMGDLLLHTTVTWLNPPASLGKGKKEPELAAFVFKTAMVFIYKDSSKQKKKLGGSHRASIYEDRDPFRFRHMIPTEALQIRSLTSADAETNLVCEIVHVKSESEGRPERAFHLCCSSPEGKAEFLKSVHSVLRDKHRRQLLKTESLPNSQQYVPFGGKRLCALKGARPMMSRTVSAPSRSLGRRRRLIRNRFTIDSDALFTNSPDESQQQSANSGDAERWVEEQFDLARYEKEEDIKETDILSSDDEYCQSVKSSTADKELEEQLQGASITGKPCCQGRRSRSLMGTHASRMTLLKKQTALSGVNGSMESNMGEVVWVRRENFVPSRKLNTDI